MVDTYLSTKFGVNSLDGFRGNALYQRPKEIEPPEGTSWEVKRTNLNKITPCIRFRGNYDTDDGRRTTDKKHHDHSC